MKNLIVIIFTVTLYTVQAQDLDSKYYLFGLTFDYSIPTYPGKRLERQKLNPWIHESDTGRLLRLSEVTGKNYRKRKPRKNCRNGHEFYELKNIPWRLGEFYDFIYTKKKGVGLKQVTGIIKREVIENATDLQMESFLAGVYNQHGSISGDTIKFQFGHVNEKLKITLRFIEPLDGVEFMTVIPVPDGTIGGGPQLLLVPKGALKEILLNERKRINALDNKSFKLSIHR